MDKTCTLDGCDRPLRYVGRGWCNFHYQRWYSYGDPLHPGRSRRQLPVCTFPDCGHPSEKRSLCGAHYRQWHRRQELHEPRGRKSRWVTAEGYAVIKIDGGHPNCDRNNLIPEHRYVMSQVLGRPLVKGEEVHHLNGVRDDNRPANLELWTKSQPAGQRVEDRIAHALELLHLYAPHLLANPDVLPLALSA